MGFAAVLFLRFVLPGTLAASTYLRRNFVSMVYLLLLAVSPLVKLPSGARRGATEAYVLVVVACSALMLVGHAAFHAALFVVQPDSSLLVDCGGLETLLRHAGFMRLDRLARADAARAVLPDAAVLGVAVATYLALRRAAPRERRARPSPVLLFAGKYLSLAVLACAAAIQPSLPGAVYLLVLVVAMNWWACGRELRQPFARALRLAQWTMLLQLCGIVAVQWQYAQDAAGDIDNLYFRLFGLTVLATTSCDNPQADRLMYADWDYYATPAVLLLGFNVLAATSRLLLRASSWDSGSEQPQSAGSDSVAIDVEGGDAGGGAARDAAPSRAEDVMDSLKNILLRDSYLIASVAMMVWSITHHSLVALVLLVWACLAWIVPPSPRTNMLRTSPLLVAYAHLLLAMQYLFSLDLEDHELPPRIGHFNINQLGFERYPRFPIGHILLKLLYTCTFWLVLRQYVLQRSDRDASTGRQNSLIESASSLTLVLMSKYWIVVAGAAWYAMSLVGSQVNLQRVGYMALFLVFVLLFQISYRLWRLLLYAMWLVVLLYSLVVLLLIYSYQFDHVAAFFQRDLGIPPRVLLDLGLEEYNTSYSLFIHLIGPVMFIAVSVIYLHVYHPLFLAVTDPYRASEPGGGTAADGAVGAGGRRTPAGAKRSAHQEDSFRAWAWRRWAAWRRHDAAVTELVWRFLMLYLVKVCLVLVAYVCVYDVCPLKLVLLMVVVVALLLGRESHLPALRLVALGVSALVLVRTVYQSHLFRHEHFDVICLDDNGTDIFEDYNLNDAEWFGMYKIGADFSYGYIIRGYTVLIPAFTLLACAVYRVDYIRARRSAATGLYDPPVTVVFPGVNRANADQGLGNFLKFVVNYGFYKFGVELCFVMVAVLMAVRLDVYACMYGAWLCVMVYLPRRTLARVWVGFVLFTAVVIPAQYLIAIGMPDSLCTVYPWYGSDLLLNIQAWFYLPGTTVKPPSYRFMCDFLVLVLACHQHHVFRAEALLCCERHEHLNGGSNEDITDRLDDPGFRNPIPDFFPMSQSWLDATKRVGCKVLLWLTLALVILAGVNRVNVFSFGYLGLAFWYLWRGERLYLRPARAVVRRWGLLLLGYNLAVMMLKMALQIVGCVLARPIMDSACWVVQLLGISCRVKASAAGHGVSECPVPDAFAGLWWDALCFAALIFTRRFFGSRYFLHLVNDTKVMIALSDKGAKLFTEYHQRKANEKWEWQQENFNRILRNNRRIVERQRRIEGPRFARKRTHIEVIQSGDYYMFETIDDIEFEEEAPRDKKILSKPMTGEALREALQTGQDDAADDAADDAPLFAEVATFDESGRPARKETRSRPVTLWWLMKLSWAMAGGLMNQLTVVLYRTSSDHLYVFERLQWNKNILKSNSEFLAGRRDGDGVWRPARPVDEYLRGANGPPERQDDDPRFWLDERQPPPVLLLSSLYYVVTCHSQYACFFSIWLIQVLSASLLSLPLPLAVFLWALFIAPHPNKPFWVAVIFYTEVIIVIKCVLQFEFIIPLEEPTMDDPPLTATRLIGVDRSSDYVAYELVLLMMLYCHRRVGFFQRLLIPTLRVPKDVYTFMFACSLVNFLILLFGFLSFGVDDPESNLLTLMGRNRIPMELLLILLVQFLVIIADRIIYLCRAVRSRVALHFVSVVVVHWWLFFILPVTTKRPFNSSLYPPMFYMVQAAYFVFSAYQIRCGFPLIVLGNVICSSYGAVNYYLFKVYLLVPFLMEMRGIMDWMFTTTSMSLMTFLATESIHGHMFRMKCKQDGEALAPRAAAVQVSPPKKHLVGGVALLLIFAIIWCPLYVFTIGMAAGTANPPHHFAVTIEVMGHAPLYRGVVQGAQINTLTQEQWDAMKALYVGNRQATAFLQNYDSDDVAVLNVPANSTAVWEASPVDQEQFRLTATNTNEELRFLVSWLVSRDSKEQSHTGKSKGMRFWTLRSDDSASRRALVRLLSYDVSTPLLLTSMLPKFLEVTNQDTAYPVQYLMPGAESEEDTYRDLELRLYLDAATQQDWWEIREPNCSDPRPTLLQQLPDFRSDCWFLPVYTFNEKMMPLSLSKLISDKGVITLYVTFVYVVAMVVRTKFISTVDAVMFEELPYVDRIMQLCVSMYLAREFENLALEEYLYAQLVFLLRSPETLIRYTRPPEPVA